MDRETAFNSKLILDIKTTIQRLLERPQLALEKFNLANIVVTVELLKFLEEKFHA